jgi:hypothetical protein
MRLSVLSALARLEFVMLTILALGTEWIVASHQLSGQVDKAHPPVSGTISRQSAPIAGR